MMLLMEEVALNLNGILQKPWTAVTFTSDYMIALRIGKKNPRYYYYHEKYGDPIDLILPRSRLESKIDNLIYYYRRKIYSLKGLDSCREHQGDRIFEIRE